MLWVQHSSSCRMGGAGTGEETNHQLVQFLQPWGCRVHLLPAWEGSSRGGTERIVLSPSSIKFLPLTSLAKLFCFVPIFQLILENLYLFLSCSQSQTWDVVPEVLQNPESGFIYSPAFPFNKFLMGSSFGSHQLHRGQKGLPGLISAVFGQLHTCSTGHHCSEKHSKSDSLTGRCPQQSCSSTILILRKSQWGHGEPSQDGEDAWDKAGLAGRGSALTLCDSSTGCGLPSTYCSLLFGEVSGAALPPLVL